MWNPGPESPLDCSRRAQATHYLRDELAPSDRAAFERHLADCESCTRDVESLRATIASLEASPVTTESHGLKAHGLKDRLAERVLDRIAPSSWSKSRRRFQVYVRATLALAAASLLICLTVLSFHGITSRVPGDDAAPPSPTHLAPTHLAPTHLAPTHLAPTHLAPTRPAASTAHSIDLAQRWLLATQEVDGSWQPSKWGGDPRYRVALTSLAILSLDAARSSTRRDAALRGLRFVASQQDESGLVGPRFRGSIYNHAVATLARLEFSHEFAAVDLGPSLDRALAFLVEAQLEHGAWGYLPRPESPANEAISLWALQALCRARAAGHSELNDSIRRASGWFRERLSDDAEHNGLYLGRGGHVCGRPNPAGSLWAIVSAAGDSRSMLSDRALRRCVDRLSAEDRTANSETYYGSYLIARAISGADLPGTAALRERLRESILDSQIRSGTHRGSWEPSDRWSPVGGRIYSTTLATMSLARAD